MMPGRRSWTRGAALALLAAVSITAIRAEDSASAVAAGTAALDIARAEELARKASDDVRAKEEAAAAALRAVDSARANLLPKLSGSVSGAYYPQTPAGVTVPAGSLPTLPLWVPATPNPIEPYTGSFVKYPVSLDPQDMTLGGFTTNTYFKGNLTFSQPLYAWGKIKAAVDLAALEARVADIGGKGAVLDAVRSANRSYYSAILSREGVSILAELRALATSILEDRKSSLDQGFATREDVLSSEADLAALDTKLVQAREGEASALAALGILTGLDPDSMALVSSFRETLPEFRRPG